MARNVSAKVLGIRVSTQAVGPADPRRVVQLMLAGDGYQQVTLVVDQPIADAFMRVNGSVDVVVTLPEQPQQDVRR